MHRALSSFVLVTALGLASADAQAGGIGLVLGGGAHTDRAYYYREDGEQGVDVQTQPNLAVGGELLLGDKDDRVQGIVRLSLMQDQPVEKPDTSGEEPGHSYTYPDYDSLGPRNIGVVLVGAQWGVLGDPTRTEFVINSLLGSGIATLDKTEFLLLQPSVGATHMLADHLQVAGNLAFDARYRKNFYLGGSANVSLRYLID